MNLTRFAGIAVLFLGVAQAAAAQSATSTGTSGTTTSGVVATIDVSRLPIDLQRIERRFRQNQIREERNGLNLRYFIDVFAKAPVLKLFTKEDNLEYGRAPYGGPTHRDMLEVMTPIEFQNKGGVNLLAPTTRR